MIKTMIIFAYFSLETFDNLGAVKSPSPYYFQMFYRIGMTQLIDVRVTRCMLRCLMMNLTHMCGHRQILIMNS